jgi:hypothetical protein
MSSSADINSSNKKVFGMLSETWETSNQSTEPNALRHEIENRIRESGSIFYQGNIDDIGTGPDGVFSVSITTANGGWTSPWPAWTHELVMAAFINRKRVIACTNGDVPFGKNLVSVRIEAD